MLASQKRVVSVNVVILVRFQCTFHGVVVDGVGGAAGRDGE